LNWSKHMLFLFDTIVVEVQRGEL